MKNAAQREVASLHDAFPLRTVAAMTGLTPDVIRAWEERYAVVTPIRGARGARLYTAADIAHLRLLTRVVAAGRSLVASANRARAVREVEAIQIALPADRELWLGGADARQVAVSVKAFRCLVVDSLQAAETELTRIAAGVTCRAWPRGGRHPE